MCANKQIRQWNGKRIFSRITLVPLSVTEKGSGANLGGSHRDVEHIYTPGTDTVRYGGWLRIANAQFR
jgi:hypothetical protein